MEPPILCINLARSTQRRARMERRFTERGLSERASFVEAVDGIEAGLAGDDLTRSARACTASHVAAYEKLLGDAVACEAGAIVMEDDVLIHRDFASMAALALANLPDGAPILNLGYMLAPAEPPLEWAGTDPGRRNLTRALPGWMWGSHCYWISPERAAEIVDTHAGVEFDDLEVGSERFTVVADGFASWPSLALQEATDSEIRSTELMVDCHFEGQGAWPLADYLGAGDDAGEIPIEGDGPPTIGLCMIVRDEAEVMQRCLESVRGLIDTWTICDTGSADGTPELIERLLEDVPGNLHHRPWVDFGHNRTELMEMARGSADLLLLIDADMTVEWRGPLARLEADSYLVRHAGDLAYWNARLVRGDIEWRYEGATHEYLASGSATTQARLEALVVHHHADSGTRGEKFERDRRLLEAELERDPDADRATFYLAQTMADLGETDRAIELYRRRVELGGWDEEVYVAQLRLASMIATEDLDAAIPELFKAFDMRPTRAEALHVLARECRYAGRHQLAYMAARRAREIPEPDDVLFVARDAHNWGIEIELGLAAHELDRLDEALASYDRLLDGRPLPREIEGSARESRRRALIRAGGMHAPERFEPISLEALAPSLRFGEVRLDIEPAWPQFNPSIASDGVGFRMIVRSANYEVDEGGAYTTLDGAEITTLNYLARLDENLTMTDVEPIVEPPGLVERGAFCVQGNEDVRLFSANGSWYGLAAARDLSPDGVAKVVLLALDDATVTRIRVVPGPDPNRHEKNWMPWVSDEGRVHIVYGCGPTVVLDLDPVAGTTSQLASHDAPAFADSFRGGSQGVSVEGGVLFVVHEAFDLGGPRRYLHRFVLLDQAWRLIAASPRVTFTGSPIEFVAGLARRGDELVVSLGLNDSVAMIATVAESEILASLRLVADDALMG